MIGFNGIVLLGAVVSVLVAPTAGILYSWTEIEVKLLCLKTFWSVRKTALHVTGSGKILKCILHVFHNVFASKVCVWRYRVLVNKQTGVWRAHSSLNRNRLSQFSAYWFYYVGVTFCIIWKSCCLLQNPHPTPQPLPIDKIYCTYIWLPKFRLCCLCMTSTEVTQCMVCDESAS